jgi:hypothetical protein
VALATLLFFTTREPTSPYDKMIGSDGKGYYAYLPAIFIHHDLSYDFVESYERTHYQAENDFFDFRIKTDTGTVNKYFPGAAILWLPFFLLAHLFSLLFKFPADGYSLPYQIAIGLAAIFYLWLGLKFLRKILQHFKVDGWLDVFVIWIIFFGTNLYYYTIEEPSFTHVYSFALINIFSLTIIRLSSKYQAIGLYILSVCLALIIITRPVNGIIIFAIPLLTGTNKNIIKLFQNIFCDRRNLFGASLIGLLIMLIIPGLWYLQSGKFLIYTYGDEKFHFLYSNMIDVLFSYHNGWLTYTPIALVSLFGFYPIFKKTFLGGLKIFSFLFVVVYFVGCWSVWWYGEAFGMRPMIEFYFVIAILLGIWIKFLRTKKILFLLTVVSLVILTVFNLFQSWQFKHSILPAKNLSSETYWENFLATTLKARVYKNYGQARLVQTFFTDMETDPGWLNYASKSDEIAFSGKLSSKINSSNTYSIGFRDNISMLLADKQYQVIVAATAYSENNNSSALFVVDFLDHAENSLGYNAFFLREFLVKNRWTQIEFATIIPSEMVDDCILAVYFWNPAIDEKLFVDDIRIEIWEVSD